MSIERVKCRVCVNEHDSFCLIKKCKTRGNKSRICSSFIHDVSKIKVKRKVETVMRPDWYWNRKEIKKAYKKWQVEEKLRLEAASNQSKYINANEPAPDCLSSFRSTASDIDIVNASGYLEDTEATMLSGAALSGTIVNLGDIGGDDYTVLFDLNKNNIADAPDCLAGVRAAVSSAGEKDENR